jgi:dCTP deaminase
MLALPKGKGVLPDWLLKEAVASGIIHSGMTITSDSFQPASLDLRLGRRAYRLQCSFLPDKANVEDKLHQYSMGKIDLIDGAILERNRPYLIPLAEELELPKSLLGRTNPKSSTGRLDIFTRVITDRSYRFDDIAPGYKGKLYLEVVSRSFTIKVQQGLSLNQLRLMTEPSTFDDVEIRGHHATEPLAFIQGMPVPADTIENGLSLSLDLSGDDTDGLVGYRAKKNSHLLDLSAREPYDAEEFWEPLTENKKNRPLILEPEEFHLLLSLEAVHVPPKMAAEMTAYDPTSGELRTHYAGFFDPGFGHSTNTDSLGSRAALEVRAHDVPFLVEHGQRVCKLRYEQMLAEPYALYGEMQSHYQFQVETLSKHFKRRVPEPPPIQLKLNGPAV